MITMHEDFSKIKDRIFCQLLSANTDRDMLAQRPYLMTADMHIVYEIEISKDDHLSVPVTNDILTMYNMSPAELHAAAIDNLENQNLRCLPYTLPEMFGFGMPDYEFHILTSDHHGAAAILSDKIMDQVSEIYPDGFYLIPSSAEEFIVCKKDESLKRDLNAVIQDAIVPELRLSGNVYEYDYATRGLTITAEHKEKESILDKLDRKKETVEERRSVLQQSKDRVIE